MCRALSDVAVIIGCSQVAEDLRQRFVRGGIRHSGVVGHVRGLRRSLVQKRNDPVVLCIALDAETLSRHGRALRTLLDDRRCFPCRFHSVGLVGAGGLSGKAAELGCDVYVQDAQEALGAVRMFARNCRRRNAASSRVGRSDADGRGVFARRKASAEGSRTRNDLGGRRRRIDETPRWQLKARGTN